MEAHRQEFQDSLVNLGVCANEIYRRLCENSLPLFPSEVIALQGEFSALPGHIEALRKSALALSKTP